MVRLLKLTLVLTSLMMTTLGFAQVDVLDSISKVQDTTQLLIDQTPVENPPSESGVDIIRPKKALYRSLMLPGLGQAYNKKYWKIPVVYVALGGVTYWAFSKRRSYRDFKEAYIAEIDGRDHQFSKFNLDAQTLRFYRDNNRKNMELAFIALVGVFGLNALEAFVDAHLQTFDVTDDIRVGLKTGYVESIGMNANRQPIPAIGLKLHLH